VVKNRKRGPRLICVTGLKNSGKTTVCTALIAELTSRGRTVAALKSSHVSRLTLDSSSGDSFALAQSGACFVLVQGPEESLIHERGGRSFADMVARVPGDAQYIISEGGDPRAAEGVILCLGDPSDWAETLRIRDIPPSRILAVSGSFVGSWDASANRTFEGFPVVDAAREEDRRTLTERILSSAVPRRS
jgi:molybdopterin-guanine dinucleotide biosynthesis protein MobB